jgi:DNA-binding Lrp family transcriptional regulator
MMGHMAYGVPPPPTPERHPQLDDADRAIIGALSADGRLSMRSLADQVHISRAGVYARVSRLEKLGVITGYAAVVEPTKIGYGVSAYIYLRIAQQSWKAVRQRISEIPEVEHAALISGDDDLALLVRTTDAESLRDLVLTRLQTMPDVISTKTVLILDELPRRRKPRSTGPPADP